MLRKDSQMNEWIDCNLPFYYKSNLLESPSYPMSEDYGLTPPYGESNENEFYEEWEKHPAHTQYEKETERIKKFNKEVLLADSHKSFCGLKLVRPGILVEIKRNSSDRIEQILIGHCDHGGSVCGDFGIFDNGDIVIRYKMIWEGPNPECINNDY